MQAWMAHTLETIEVLRGFYDRLAAWQAGVTVMEGAFYLVLEELAGVGCWIGWTAVR